MKKLLIMILALSMALAFASCGGRSDEKSADSTVYLNCFTVDVPEGFEWNEEIQTFEDTEDPSRFIYVMINFDSAQSNFDYDLGNFPSSVVEDDITVGDYTWKVLKADTSFNLYGILPEDTSASLGVSGLDLEDLMMQSFLESIKFEDDACEKYWSND